MVKKLLLSIVAFIAAMAVNAQETVLIDYPNSTENIEGIDETNVLVTSVKIHLNHDYVNCLQIKRSHTNGVYLTLSTDGGFKKGDKVTIAGIINTSDETKRATAVILDEGMNVIYTFSDFINGKLTNDDPVEESYTLTENSEYLYIGRDGNTNANISTLKVTRVAQKYTITCNPTDNGTVETDLAEATAGTTVTITATPDAGYELATLAVVDEESKAVALNGTTFIMPESNVTVTATFKEEGAPEEMGVVEISGNEFFTNSTTVTITSPNFGATIYYTTDGTDPTSGSTQYSIPFDVTETTTVKAIAIKNGNSSDVAEKTFTFAHEAWGLGDIISGDDGTTYSFGSNWAGIAAKPSNDYMYLFDGSWLLVDDSEAGGANIAGAENYIGKTLAAGWVGTKKVVNNQPSIVLHDAITIDPENNEVWYSFDTVNPDFVQDYNVNNIVTIQAVSYTLDGDNLTISKNGYDAVAGYNKFGKEIAAPEDGKTYDITGAIGIDGDVVQFWPISIEEHIPAVVSLPSRVRMYVDGTRVNANTPIAAGTAVELRPSGSAYLITATPVVTRTPSGTAVEVTDNGDGTYTFVMPNEDVEISAEVKKNIASEWITVNDAVWTGEAVTPTIDIYIDESNYNLSYKKDGVEITADQIIATGEYTAVFTGTGNYTGVKEINFFVIRTEAVSIPKETYVTRFFNGEMCYTDFYSVKFYVVSSVTDNEVVLAEVEAKQIPANTPFLIYNEEPSTINFNLLDNGTPAEALTVEVAPEFKGTDEAREFAESEDVDYYICNGKDFVYVKGAGTLAAHRCWLELSKTNGARQLSIVINDDQTTGINLNVNDDHNVDAPRYNINGQRVSESYKGFVIVNGKKYINK